MFEQAVKDNASCHEQTANDLARIEQKLETASAQTQNCILGVWLFVLVNMFLTASAVFYAFQVKTEATAVKQQIEKLNQTADKFEGKFK